jgi:hypothetical protein
MALRRGCQRWRAHRPPLPMTTHTNSDNGNRLNIPSSEKRWQDAGVLSASSRSLRARRPGRKTSSAARPVGGMCRTRTPAFAGLACRGRSSLACFYSSRPYVVSHMDPGCKAKRGVHLI